MRNAIVQQAPELGLEPALSPPNIPAAKQGDRALDIRWIACLLGFALVYALVFCAAIPSFIDEAYSFNLATDKSLAHMLAALRDGADGTFPLYAIILFCWEKLFGSSEMSLRLSSGVFVLCFVWHSGKRLVRHFGPAASALAVLFVLANWAFTFYGLQVRFYGLLIFLFSLCFWSTWDLLQTKTISLLGRLAHAFFCGLVCLSHPLGLVYAGTLALVYFSFSILLRKFSFANAATFLGGPVLFLVWLPSFLTQRLVNPAYPAAQPGVAKYWDFAFYGSTLLILTLLAGAAMFIGLRWASRSKANTPSPDAQSSWSRNDSPGVSSNRLVILYSLALVFFLNGVMALLDSLHVVSVYWTGEGGIRYGLVCWVAYAVVVAAIFFTAARLLKNVSDRFRVQFSQRMQFVVAVIALLVLMESHWGAWFRMRANDCSYLAKISSIAKEKHLDVVCQRHWDAFYLATRTDTEHVQYLLADGFPYKHLMLQVAKYYPNPVPIDPAIRAQSTNEYLFLSYSPRDAWIVGKR